MMSIYPIVHIQLSFVQFSLLCYEFCILSKKNVRAFIIILGVTMKAVAFEIKPEINGFVEKFMFFSRDQFTLLAINSIFSGN